MGLHLLQAAQGVYNTCGERRLLLLALRMRIRAEDRGPGVALQTQKHHLLQPPAAQFGNVLDS